jgi:NHL repeat.
LLGVCWFLAADFTQAQIILIDRLQDAVSMDASSRHLFVLERGKDRFLKLDFDGMLLDSLGSRGSGDYQFDEPADIDVSNGLRIYISDSGNNRIQVYDRRFQYLSSLPVRNPAAIHVTPFNEVLVFEKNSKIMRLFDEFGQERPRFNMPAEIRDVRRVKSDERRLYVLDPAAGVVHELERSGLYRSFFPASEVTAFTTRMDRLYFADDKTVFSAETGEQMVNFPNAEIRDLLHVEGDGWYLLTAQSLIFYAD